MLSRLRRFARTTLQTRSLRAAWQLCVQTRGDASVRLPGYPGSFRFRCGTSDAQFVRMLAAGALPAEYAIPEGFNPRVILDIGANIGAVAAAFLRRWPAARLFAFEPLPDNAALLRMNLAAFSNASVQSYGLGDRTARMTYERSDDPQNFGGGGFHGAQLDPTCLIEGLPVVAVHEALAQLEIDRVDLIKIDTEGAEHAILTSFPPEILRRTKMIVGELHGKPDDAALLEYLRRWFDVELLSHDGGTSASGFRCTPSRLRVDLASRLRAYLPSAPAPIPGREG